ncbi:MAG TPA: hypothetical protein VH682_32950 [Gemmataceae bacterium]|jgi:hypothetical protein
MTTLAASNGFQSPPRSAQEIKRQLADLAKVKAKADAYGVRDFASQLGLQSLRGQEQSLIEELRAAEMLESGSAAELVFGGDPVRDHLIQAGFLGAMFSKVQQLVNALAQAITSVPTARAPVPRNIVAENRLLVASWFPSSFAVRLCLPTKEELGQMYDTESQSVLEGLAELLGEQVPSQQTIDWVSHPRVRKHYYEFLDAVAKQGAMIRLRTQGNPYGAAVDAQQARERVDWLDLLTVKEETLSLSGTLVGGSIETGRFELKVEDEVYKGKVSEGTKVLMKQITFGASVQARVRVTTLVHEEGATESATSYFLEAIELRT